MNFRKVNNIAGWVVCAIASLVYILTAEMRGSFWDCGEFVSACYKVQLPHPPGAPLFVLLGRFFIILFGDDPMMAAKAVNVMNALASGFTILFLFWSITHFARKLMTGFHEDPTSAQMYTIIGAGVVGGLAYTFSDSFWYSAVEGEVYALSSMFTALAFWIILKWERANEAAGNDRQLRNRADRWIVFFFFALGLSIGIHLLGLLVIPAAVMVYYYNRYKYTQRGAIFAFVLGCIITGLVQVVVIKWSVQLAGVFDRIFVNSFHLPFFSGFAFFFVLLAVLVWAGLKWANKNNWSYLRLSLWCFAFMMFGYSTYMTTMIRSNANPSLDMNNVDNPMNLVYYLGREQYGSQPILYGQHFLSRPVDLKETKVRYSKGKDSYVALPPDKEYVYPPGDYRYFIRTWDASNDQQHADYYVDWLSLAEQVSQGYYAVGGIDMENGVIQLQNLQTQKIENLSFDPATQAPGPHVQRGAQLEPRDALIVKIPTYADNIQWFMSYQMGFMYWRYFMWNFAGKQNDIQGAGNKRDGNWKTGISVIDNSRLGDQSKLPESIRHNKENNKLFLLPFILGVIGLVYQFVKNRRDWIVTFLLFFFTGIAIVVYLNQAGNQPRERDYAFSGSFYAFAIWIGLSVVALARMATVEREEKSILNNTTLFSGLTAFLILLMSDANNINGGSIFSALLASLLCAGLTYGLTLLVRSVAGKNFNLRTAGLVATALCLITPVVMASQEWDDHDRSKKLLAPDIARDYLEGCPKDAILFTFGDNDTYPLWYAQEVEGVRPDVRIINTSLLGIDWYVNQLRYKVNESAPVNIVWTEDQLRGVSYLQNARDRSNRTADLAQFLKNDIGNLLNKDERTEMSVTFPSHLTIPVDVNYIRQQGWVKAGDSVGTQVQLDLNPDKGYYSLDQLTMLNVLATTNWRRPVCFTSYYPELGLAPYLRQNGLIYQVMPFNQHTDGRSPSMDLDGTKDLLMNKFRTGNANRPGVYFDEENRRHLLSIRRVYSQAAINLAEFGRVEEGKALLDKSETLIHPEGLPYGMVSRGNDHNRVSLLYLQAAYRTNNSALVNKVEPALRKDLRDQIAYYEYLRDDKSEFYTSDMIEDESFCRRLLEMIDEMKKNANPPPPVIEKPGQASGQQPNDTTKRP